MRWPRLLPLVMVVVLAAGCGPDEDDDGASPLPPPPPAPADPAAPAEPPSAPAAPSYQVTDDLCPVGWSGLLVTTDNDAEVEYLDDMPACTDGSGGATYLNNRSDAVWVLRATTEAGGTTRYEDQTLRESSFLSAVQAERPGQPLLVPGASITVDLAPEGMEWVIDLPLSAGWQAHDVLVDRISGAGEVAAIAALQRRSRAGAALGTCALATTKYAETVRDLEDSDAVDVVLGGLGVGAASSACYVATATVPSVDEAGQPLPLADDLARLQRQDAILQTVDARLGYAQRAFKVLDLGLKYLR